MPVIPLAARDESVAADQGGTPDTPRGCPPHSAGPPVPPAPLIKARAPLAAAGTNPHSGSARWISSCPLLGSAGTVRSAGTLRGGSDRHGQWRSPRTVGAFVSSAPRCCHLGAGVAAARDPHPRDGRDRRDEDRDGPSGFGSIATLRRFVLYGDLTAEHHGRRGRGRPRFALTATSGSPASRPSLPAPHWPDPRCPARRLRLRHQGGGRVAPAASFQPEGERRGGVAVHRRWPA